MVVPEVFALPISEILRDGGTLLGLNPIPYHEPRVTPCGGVTTSETHLEAR